MDRKLKTHHSSFIIRKSAGFTLIELMVVLSITAVLGTLGIAGFTIYNQIQILQSSASDVATTLNLAKSRAQSQIKPSALCPSGTLDGYRVIISPITSPKSYTLYLVCSGADKKIDEQDKVLPGDVNFDSSISFFFPVQAGGVQTPGQATVSAYLRSKTIMVNALGGVAVQ